VRAHLDARSELLDRNGVVPLSDSTLFTDDSERERAKTIAVERGAAIEPRTPLGYRESAALICFESRCPNNTLPILRKDGPTWEALFPR
jgi:hypothetical protein